MKYFLATPCYISHACLLNTFIAHSLLVSFIAKKKFFLPAPLMHIYPLAYSSFVTFRHREKMNRKVINKMLLSKKK